MQIDERTVGSVKVLDLAGQVTFTQGDTILKDKIHSLVNQGHKHIIVNLGNVSYLDSSGLGHLVAAYTTVANAGGRLKLINLTKKLQTLMTMTKLLTVFDVFDSEQEAVKSFN
jgi:anti-sigma B factor antagonist